MTKFKKRKFVKRILYLCFSLAISFTSFFHFYYEAKALSLEPTETIVEGNYIYVLPPIPLSRDWSRYAFLPGFIVSIDETREVTLYTMTAAGTSSNYQYVKREFSVDTENPPWKICRFSFAMFAGSGANMVCRWDSDYGLTQPSEINYRYRGNGDFSLSTMSLDFNVGSLSVEYTPNDQYIAPFNTVVLIELTNSTGKLQFEIWTYQNTSIVADNKNYTIDFSPTRILGTNIDSNAYERGYDYGYNLGKIEGYNNGYNAGVNDSNDYTFRNLFSAIIDVPINAFKAILNFQFLDINLLDFVTSLLTLVICIKIIAMIF